MRKKAEMFTTFKHQFKIPTTTLTLTLRFKIQTWAHLYIRQVKENALYVI